MTVTNLGKWDRWNTKPHPYGDTATYQIAADFLAPCDFIEDWGCGGGWMRRFIPADRYRGIDGSTSPCADVIADLADYRSDVSGVVMRHVLEHDYRWTELLDNAIASARQRLCVILFTPLAEQTHEIAFAPDPGVPDISFRLADLVDPIGAGGFTVETQTIASKTQYGVETVLRCIR